jgi:diadenosine tetraphosphatase ApaH/serine/threonine PP2A family protein phosphatase
LHVTPQTKKYLAQLPFRIDIRPFGGHVSGPTITLIHGNQTLNTVYVTEDRLDSFLEKMARDIGARAGDTIAFGHTHKPWQRAVGGIQFINTGSVGRPKDGDWRACYVMLSIEASGSGAEFIRVPYDVDEAADAIRVSDLPAEFAEALKAGGTSPAGTPTSSVAS